MPAALALKHIVRSEIADSLGDKDTARGELETVPLAEVTLPSVLEAYYERADALYRQLGDREALAAAARALAEHPALRRRRAAALCARGSVRALVRGLPYDEADAVLAQVGGAAESELAFAIELDARGQRHSRRGAAARGARRDRGALQEADAPRSPARHHARRRRARRAAGGGEAGRGAGAALRRRRAARHARAAARRAAVRARHALARLSPPRQQAPGAGARHVPPGGRHHRLARGAHRLRRSAARRGQDAGRAACGVRRRVARARRRPPTSSTPI